MPSFPSYTTWLLNKMLIALQSVQQLRIEMQEINALKNNCGRKTVFYTMMVKYESQYKCEQNRIIYSIYLSIYLLLLLLVVFYLNDVCILKEHICYLNIII